MEGFIIKNISNDYVVKCGNNIYNCKARGKFRNMKLIPLVGDYVTIDENDLYILDIKERKNSLVRPSIANVDQAIIVSSVKNPDLEDKEKIAEIIGIGAVIFNDLYNSRVKDEIFDWDEMLNFNGETGPYLQYMYVRTNSILQKAGYIPNIEDVDFELLNDNSSVNIIKTLYSFGDMVKQSAEKYEPYIIARYLIGLAQAFSSFYNENKIIVEDKKVQDARLYLTYAVNTVLKSGASLLGMKMPERM